MSNFNDLKKEFLKSQIEEAKKENCVLMMEIRKIK